jgi:hypothetical protein
MVWGAPFYEGAILALEVSTHMTPSVKIVHQLLIDHVFWGATATGATCSCGWKSQGAHTSDEFALWRSHAANTIIAALLSSPEFERITAPPRQEITLEEGLTVVLRFVRDFIA